MKEDDFKKFLLEKIEEICEEVHQQGEDSCPFCCQPEYPVNGDIEGYEDLDELGLEAESYKIDHDDDCLITVLDKYYIKIRDKGLWC